MNKTERFKLPSKKVFRMDNPGPGAYNVTFSWEVILLLKGKSGSLPKGIKDSSSTFYKRITKGSDTTRSIYY